MRQDENTHAMGHSCNPLCCLFGIYPGCPKVACFTWLPTCLWVANALGRQRLPILFDANDAKHVLIFLKSPIIFFFETNRSRLIFLASCIICSLWIFWPLRFLFPPDVASRLSLSSIILASEPFWSLSLSGLYAFSFLWIFLASWFSLSFHVFSFLCYPGLWIFWPSSVF